MPRPARSSGAAPSPSRARTSGSRALLRLWPWVRPYRRGLALMVGADVLALMTQTVTPIVIARMIDGPIRGGNASAIWRAALLLLGLALAQTFFYVVRRWPTRDAPRIAAALRADLYRQTHRLDPRHHDRAGSGHAVSRLVGDVEQIARFHQMTFVFLVSNTVTLVLTAIVLVWIHPLLGTAVLVAMIPLGFASTVFQTRFRAAARAARDRAGEVATSAEESATGIRVLKALGAGPTMLGRFDAAAGAARDAEQEKIRLSSVYNSALIAYPLAVLALVVVGGGLAVAHDHISLGAFVAFATFYFRMLFPVSVMGSLLSGTQETASAATRVMELLDAKPAIADPRDPEPLPVGSQLGVRFERVDFGYGDSMPVLAGLSLEVEPGETLALVGATGSGKSALLALVARLADPSAGAVLVGDVDVRRVRLDELRREVGFAFEDATLFSTSVRDNLTFGRPGIAEEEIVQALEITRAGFVDRLPEGLETVVGEQGLTLSGGQRQRLALARALLGRPRVLVLDDPMSALDVRTEEAVERRLRAVFTGVTVVMVARRPSTALLADRVAVLDGGRVVDVGTHEDLLIRSERYRQLLVAADERPGSPEDHGRQEGDDDRHADEGAVVLGSTGRPW